MKHIKCPKCGFEISLEKPRKDKDLKKTSAAKQLSVSNQRKETVAPKYIYHVPPSIFVVDGNLIFPGSTDMYKLIFKCLLGDQNYNYEQANSRVDVFEIIKRQEKEFDVVFADFRGLADYNYRKDDGLEFISEIKKKSPNSEIVIITAYESIGSRSKATEYGVMEYLRKPFMMEEISKLLAQAMRKKYGSNIVENI